MDTISAIEALNNSPLYNLSLSSKELFHSNFMAWLGQNPKTKPLFISIIKTLSGLDLGLSKYDGWVVKREFSLSVDKNKEDNGFRDYKSVDICILDKEKDGNILLALENKVKAVPDENQLEAYKNKIVSSHKSLTETKYVLLSLMNFFGTQREVNGWLIRSYRDYANAMKDFNSICDVYIQGLVSDYQQMAFNLQECVDRWSNSFQTFLGESKEMGKTAKEEAADIRFDDVVEKLRVAKALTVLKSKIACNPLVPIKQLANKCYPNGVYAAIGLTRTIGILDVKIKCNDEYVVGIQVQGNNYRHFVEFMRNDVHSLDDSWKNLMLDSRLIQLQWFRFVDSAPTVNFGDRSIFKSYELLANPSKTNPSYHYNRFEDKTGNCHFLYQGMIVSEQASVDAVIDNIVNEIKRIQTVYSLHLS